jgi:hypothetical protein
MSALKMMWFEMDGQLVCRWVDESESAETVLRRLKDDPETSTGAARTGQPSFAVAKAA